MGKMRLFLLLVLNVPLLVILSNRGRFERSWMDSGRDAAIAYAIGILSSFIILFGFAVLPSAGYGTKITVRAAGYSDP